MDADRALLELARSNHHLVRRLDVTRAGVSPKQWRLRRERGEWVQVCSGVWRHALTPETWQLRARAGVMHLGAPVALYGVTSLAWWALPIPDPTDVEFLVPRGRRHLSNDLIIHTTDHWDRADLYLRDGVQTTSVTRAIIDAASTRISATMLEKVIDAAMSNRQTSLPTLSKRMKELSGPGHHGIPRLRALILDSGGESFLERKFLKLVRRNRLPRPTCQVVHRKNGRIIRVDFQFPGTNVIVEVTGRLGHTTDRDRQRDARRRNALTQAGCEVLEFTTADVLDDAPYVINTLKTSLASCRPAPEGTVSMA